MFQFEIPLVDQAGYEIDMLSVGDDDKGLRAKQGGSTAYHG